MFDVKCTIKDAREGKNFNELTVNSTDAVNLIKLTIHSSSDSEILVNAYDLIDAAENCMKTGEDKSLSILKWPVAIPRSAFSDPCAKCDKAFGSNNW